jgi:hypothetical protein
MATLNRAPDQLVVCLQSFAGAAGVVREGDRVRADHPAALAHPDKFADVNLPDAELHRLRVALGVRSYPFPPPKPSAKKVTRYRAKETFTVRVPPDATGFAGGLMRCAAGDILGEDHMLVKRFPRRFERVTE